MEKKGERMTKNEEKGTKKERIRKKVKLDCNGSHIIKFMK